MFTPVNTPEYNFEVKNSKFITRIYKISTKEEAKEITAATWKQHPGARHVVYAFIIGKKAELFGMTDDGEPSGTAGMPTLEVIKGKNLTNVLAVTVRYFGGTKLGTGGLVKAYSESVKGAVALLETEELIEKTTLKIILEYHFLNKVQLLFDETVTVKDQVFTDKVEQTLELPASIRNQLITSITDATNGTAIIS